LIFPYITILPAAAQQASICPSIYVPGDDCDRPMTSESNMRKIDKRLPELQAATEKINDKTNNQSNKMRI
jgi:hypothetical protein